MQHPVLALARNALERRYSGDPCAFAEISDKAITVVEPNLVRPIIGLDQYKAYLKQFEETIRPQIVEITNALVQEHDPVAVLTYQYHADEGRTVGQVGWNVTEVYARLDGNWKLVHMHRAYLKHQLPAAVEVPLPVALSPQAYAGVLGEVMALEAAAMHRWRKGDPWGFIAINDTTITYFDTGTSQRLDGLETLRAEYATREGKIFYDVAEFIDPHIQVYGDVAVLLYRFF